MTTIIFQHHSGRPMQILHITKNKKIEIIGVEEEAQQEKLQTGLPQELFQRRY